MTLVLYHRTSMAEAHEIVRKGFEDLDWDFGLTDARTGEETVVTGTWLSDQPLSQRDGIDGDALLRIDVEALEDELAPFALEGLLWHAKLWVVPSEWVNARGTVRFAEVDPRSSGLHPAIDLDDDTPSGEDRG
ncbi:MAG: hypothetical protein AMS20_09910 [Gemmatimonas sp. SG8_28]|nr:MAG: hypothetical protein AMS20_09910 [Gemmatimonas sp. SG8_28]